MCSPSSAKTAAAFAAMTTPNSRSTNLENRAKRASLCGSSSRANARLIPLARICATKMSRGPTCTGGALVPARRSRDLAARCVTGSAGWRYTRRLPRRLRSCCSRWRSRSSSLRRRAPSQPRTPVPARTASWPCAEVAERAGEFAPAELHHESGDKHAADDQDVEVRRQEPESSAHASILGIKR